MQKKDVYVIGMMSGTSLDGVDLVYVKFTKQNYNAFEIVYSKTIEYEEVWREKLKEAIHYTKEQLVEINKEYAFLLAELIHVFINEFDIKAIDFIASHGHTILHQPDKGITLQIGDGQIIANEVRQKVVCDFRTQDVSLGGQGAPLVPIGDELLFSEYDYCLNLGGFANISYKQNNKRIAFDICPVNIVLNVYAQKLGFDYDDKGSLAKSGAYLLALGEALNSLDFYKQLPPKSLGLEWVQKEIFPIIDSSKRNPIDVLRTFTEHIAWAIAKVLPKQARVLVTGGGAFNTYLLKRIKYYKDVTLIVPEEDIINFKEALIFAFLGFLKLDNQVNCLGSVTGAVKDHSSGVIFYPNN